MSEQLHQAQPHLHATQEVEMVVDYLRANGAPIPEVPRGKGVEFSEAEAARAAKVGAFIEFLADPEYVNDGILTGDTESIQRQVDAGVMPAENVPDSYFRRRNATNVADGKRELTHADREKLTQEIQTNQHDSLEDWAAYLGDNEAGYPDWFRIYAFDGVHRMGAFNKDSMAYRRRDEQSVAPYPDLNAEALAGVFEAVSSGEAGRAPFSKLYSEAMTRLARLPSVEEQHITDGAWRKFDQTTDAAVAVELSSTLQGTGWCTASARTAGNQLSGGDFYVFYSNDEQGQPRIPRVAVRMRDGVVAETRGILPGQGMEAVMADVVSEKLATLPGGEEYVRKAADMQMLTSIEQKIAANPDEVLTEAETRLLYELDRDVEGFGHHKDPRIGEIRNQRGERDTAELRRLVPETIRAQAHTSYEAYAAVAEQLKSKIPFVGPKVLSEQDFVKLFEANEAEWQTNGTYDYLVEQLRQGIKHTLVSTPNARITTKQLEKVAGAYDTRPYGARPLTYRDNPKLLEETTRLANEAVSKGPVRMSLVATEFDPDMKQADSHEAQLAQLAARQGARPDLGLHVPDVLEAFSLWHTLRNQGKITADTKSNAERTKVTHIEANPVPDRRSPDRLLLPASQVVGASVYLISHAVGVNDVRLAVGKTGRAA